MHLHAVGRAADNVPANFADEKEEHIQDKISRQG